MFVVASKVESEKRRIFDGCQHCEKKGCEVCEKACGLIDKFAASNIPVSYWYLKLKDFGGAKNLKEATLKYIAELEENFSTGSSIVFAGSYGVGKSSCASAILKNAVMKGHSAYYTTLTDMSNYLIDDRKNEFYHLVSRSDFLCIDECDSRYISSSDQAQQFHGTHLERVVRYRVQNKMPLLLATNNSSLDDLFQGQFKRVFASLENLLTTVSILGKDQRVGKKE